MQVKKINKIKNEMNEGKPFKQKIYIIISNIINIINKYSKFMYF